MSDPSSLGKVIQLASRFTAPEESADAYGARMARDKRAENLARSGISPAIPAADLRLLVVDGKMKPTKALASVKRWDALPATHEMYPFLVLSGLQGRGKTLAAGWCLASCGGAYVLEDELPQRIFDGDPALRSGFLVLDQFGDHMTPHYKTAIFDILNKRQGNGMRTLFCTTLAKHDLRSEITNPAFWSRVDNRGAWVECDGVDLREVK